MNYYKLDQIQGYQARETYREWYKRLEDNGLDPETLDVHGGKYSDRHSVVIQGRKIGEYIYASGKIKLNDPDLVYDVFNGELLLQGQSRSRKRPIIERTPMDLVAFLKDHIGLNF